MGGRADRDSLSGRSSAASRDRRTGAQGRHPPGGRQTAQAVALEAIGEPPMAQTRRGGGAATQNQLVAEGKKGDTSNEVSRGTFLKWVDIRPTAIDIRAHSYLHFILKGEALCDAS